MNARKRDETPDQEHSDPGLEPEAPDQDPAIAELTPAKDGFFVTFTLEEGDRYRFGKIDLQSKIRELNASEIRPLVTVKEGDWYNADEVEKTITALTDALGNRGYAFVEVQPRVNRNRETHTIDVTFEVQEGPRVFVERAIPVLRVFDRAGSILDRSAHRILLVGEDRHHRLAIPHAAPSVFNRHPLAELLAAGDTPGQASTTLRELGFTHVIVDPAGVLSSAGRYPSLALFRERPDRLEDYLRSLGEPLDSEGGTGLFNLAVPEPGPPGDRR